MAMVAVGERRALAKAMPNLRPAGDLSGHYSPEFAINGDKLLRYNISYLGGKSDRQALYRWNNVRYDEKGDALNGRMMDNDINQLIDALLKSRPASAGFISPARRARLLHQWCRWIFPSEYPPRWAVARPALGDNAPLLEAHDVLYIRR